MKVITDTRKTEASAIEMAESMASSDLKSGLEYKHLTQRRWEAYSDKDQISLEQRLWSTYSDSELSKFYAETQKKINAADAAYDSYLAKHLITVKSPSDTDLVKKLGLPYHGVMASDSLFAVTSTRPNADVYFVYKVNLER